MDDSLLSIQDILTDSSKKKLFYLESVPRWNLYPNKDLYELFDNCALAFTKKIDMFMIEQIDIHILRNIFCDFDRSFNNIVNSKLQMDISKMNRSLSIGININNDTIKMHFLYNDISKKIGYVSAIIHAINTFCYLFASNYEGLNIYICLDDNCRNLVFPKYYHDYKNIFKYLHKHSSAFCISGVTYKDQKKIILTKSEEIIKLLFHELIHFASLDEKLIGIGNNFKLDVDKYNLNASESYTELLSVILNSAYQTIHIFGIKKLDKYWIFNKILELEFNYSILLSSKILKFYGYDKYTYQFFFQKNDKRNQSPIPIWEYVILRSQLFCNIDKITYLRRKNWYIDDPFAIIKMMEIDENFLYKLSIQMSDEKIFDNLSVSYVTIDLDWSLI